MRKWSALFMAGLLTVAVVGCSTKKSEDVSAGATTTEATSEDETTTTKKSSTTTEGTDSTSDSDSGDDVPALGDLGDCLEVSLTYAGLFLGATFATDEQMAEIEQSLEEIKGKVPADIQDDMEVIAQGMADADGIVGLGEFMDSDEFKEADANIQAYFEETCNMDSDTGN